jgi:hypothetical protein
MTRNKIKVVTDPRLPDMDIAYCGVPVKILVPRDCVAEVYTCPQGTEIKIRYSSKIPIHEEDLSTSGDRAFLDVGDGI